MSTTGITPPSLSPPPTVHESVQNASRADVRARTRSVPRSATDGPRGSPMHDPSERQPVDVVPNSSDSTRHALPCGTVRTERFNAPPLVHQIGRSETAPGAIAAAGAPFRTERFNAPPLVHEIGLSTTRAARRRAASGAADGGGGLDRRGSGGTGLSYRRWGWGWLGVGRSSRWRRWRRRRRRWARRSRSRWRSDGWISGCDERSVWGRCSGSGAEPYETAVDHVDVAWRCSCPSRKLPCKHALALLVMWVRGVVPEAAPPPAVARWTRSRAGRADRPTVKPVAEPDQSGRSRIRHGTRHRDRDRDRRRHRR